MASKQVDIPEIGTVTLYKRKAVRTIRLSVTAQGQIRVTMPYWVPYEAGLRFARSRSDWIQQQLEAHSTLLLNGQIIGKMHHLSFTVAPPEALKITSRVTHAEVRVSYPKAYQTSDPAVQAAAAKASIRALRSQAELLLPSRLKGLAMMHEFEFNSVQVKQLRGRWGSCDAQQNIVLNLFLMQLPWELIDYVLLHELTHTRILRHGPDFWAAMQQVLPDVQVRRKAMRSYRPAVR